MKLSQVIFGAAVAIVISAITFSAVFAVEYGGGSVKGYAADSHIDPGTIVELTGENADRVKVSTQKDLQNMFGVVVDHQQIPVRISDGSIENEVYVAVSGTYDVLVSTQGGDIASGDYLTLSSINGVAMKAGTEEPTVFGRAAGSFGENSTGLGSAVLQDVNGNSSGTVKLGTVPVTIDIRNNPNDISTKANLPEMLQRVGQAIAEKEVSPVRIYLSIAIAIICMIAAFVVLYAGIRNAVVAIGRNPMSRRSIFRALLEVILTSVLILIIGLFAVYLLLRL